MHRFPWLLAIVSVVVITYWEYVQYVIACILVLLVFRYSVGISRFVHRLVTGRRLSHVDAMDGLEFERYIADILKAQGYTNIQFTEKYDYGVDIIAVKDGIRWGIQVKRYSGLVKADAVRQVVTGLRVYNCDRAMVITNSVFSRVAVRLADSNGCILVDSIGLTKKGIHI